MLLPTLNCTKEDAVLACRIELETEKTGKAVSRTDTMIAAITIDNGAKLYAFSSKHFSEIRSMGLILLE